MDKYAKVEKLLSNYKMYKISIENLEIEIEYIKEEDGLKGIDFEGISTSPTNVTSDITSDTVLSKMEKVHYLERTIERNQKDIESVDRALDGLEGIEKTVVVERYINARQWWQVASVAKYSERHCKRIRTEAINKLAVGIFG